MNKTVSNMKRLEGPTHAWCILTFQDLGLERPSFLLGSVVGDVSEGPGAVSHCLLTENFLTLQGCTSFISLVLQHVCSCLEGGQGKVQDGSASHPSSAYGLQGRLHTGIRYETRFPSWLAGNFLPYRK